MSRQEIKELGDFVKSPFFNKNDKVSHLYVLIRKHYPEFDSPSLKKEKLYSKIYPGEKFKDSTMRLLIFYLYECVKIYLQVKRGINDSYTANINLSGEMIDRGLLREAEKIINENNKMLESISFKDESYFWNKYLNGMELLTGRERQFAGRYEKYMTGEILNELSENLTDNYLLRLLKLYTIALNTNAMFKTRFNPFYYGNIINSFDKDYFKDRPIMLAYYYAAKILEDPENENNYYSFKKIVIENESSFDNSSKIDLFINLENYCVRRGRKGIKKFDRELFEIYKMEIEKKIYKVGNYMGHYFYKSAATTALIVNEPEWAEKFIEEFRNELIPGFRDPAYFHCLARIYLVKKNYNKALEFLSKVNTDEIYLKTETRLLFAVIYYELGIEDSLRYLLDTMRHFFKNDRYLADDRNEFYAHFVRFLNKLNNLRYKESKAELMELKKKIVSVEKLFSKNWLLEKISELEKN